jgi:hypothetical protein
MINLLYFKLWWFEKSSINYLDLMLMLEIISIFNIHLFLLFLCMFLWLLVTFWFILSTLYFSLSWTEIVVLFFFQLSGLLFLFSAFKAFIITTMSWFSKTISHCIDMRFFYFTSFILIFTMISTRSKWYKFTDSLLTICIWMWFRIFNSIWLCIL